MKYGQARNPTAPEKWHELFPYPPYFRKHNPPPSPSCSQVASIQFHLINTSILLLSREGFRRACIRIDAGHPSGVRRLLGTAVITLPIGLTLSAGVTLALLARQPPAADEAYVQALVMQGAQLHAEGSKAVQC
jgi:hypothetical protein